jgi:hypothetical protein
MGVDAHFNSLAATDAKAVGQLESIDEQIGFKNKGKTIKGKNHILAKELLLEDIEGTDLLTFAKQVKQYLENET